MCVSVTVARGLAAHLQRDGIDPLLLWRRVGLTSEQAADPWAQLDFAQTRALLAGVRALSDDPAVLLHAAYAAPTKLLALMGHLLANCATLRDAYRVYREYAALLTPDSHWVLEEEGSTAAFVYEFPVQYASVEVDATEAGMALATAFGWLYLGRAQRNVEACFRYPAPSYTHAYDDLFRCPLRFNAARSALVFERSTLDVRQLADDSAAWTALQARAQSLLLRHNDATMLADRVMTAVLHEPDLGAVTVERVAKRLRMSPRALRRRLREEERPFHVLFGEVRRELACEALRQPDPEIRAVSESLGFSEVSAFHRAFKRWTGSTPREYRHMHACQLA